MSGRVRTADGGSIPGAAVTLADLSGRQVAVAQTDTAGQYRLSAPGAGSYLVIVSAPGHQPTASVLAAPGAPRWPRVTDVPGKRTLRSRGRSDPCSAVSDLAVSSQ